MPEADSARLPTGSRPALMQAGKAALWLALVAAYLASSAMGQRAMATATVGLMLGALLAASGRLLTGLLTGASLAVVCWMFSGTMQFLVYAPPLAAFAFMAWFFFRTLRPGCEALITQVARKERADLAPEIARYTRALTWTWTLAFLSMLVTALALVPMLAFDTWSRTVHMLGYIFPAALFLGEYAYRHFHFRHTPHSSLLVLIPNIIRVIREIALADGKRRLDSSR